MSRSTAELRNNARNEALRILEELRVRPLNMMLTPQLIEQFKVLANFGGLPPSDKAWEAAMQTLASQHVSEAQKTRILDLLAGTTGAKELEESEE